MPRKHAKSGGNGNAARATSQEYLDPILDAAEAVVLRDGIGRLTLDAVAKKMGLSKAGLLHHFPSKSEMVRGMVERHVAQ
ncbi:MAG: TetR/AcrR family transcriptional regulator [Phycisphaerales bacterium]|nr:TetR/AcrR family transcriptional regulator [Phycisphaerales bacterium]